MQEVYGEGKVHPAAMEQKISTEEGILHRVNRVIQSEGIFAMSKEWPTTAS